MDTGKSSGLYCKYGSENIINFTSRNKYYRGERNWKNIYIC